MLVHREPLATTSAFDLDALKQFLRVDHSDEDATIENIGKTAALELEHFAQLALLNQTVRVSILDPRACDHGLTLPVGPIAASETPVVQIDGEAFTDFSVTSGIRPFLTWRGAWYEMTPDRIVIDYVAGFGASAAEIPPDLAQAVMDQALLLYDGRSPADPRQSSASPHLARIGARYRGVSV